MLVPSPAPQHTGRGIILHLRVEKLSGIKAFMEPMTLKNDVIFLQGKHTE